MLSKTRICERLAGNFLALAIIASIVFCPVISEGRSESPFSLLSEYNQAVEYYPERSWSKLASPELAGWSTNKLEEARRFSKSIHSAAVVIIENGIIVAEWGDITGRFKLHSVRKSLMSAMIGILVDENRLNPAYTLKQLQITDTGGLSPKEERATVHDLLTARSGVYHPAAYETDGMEAKRPPRDSHDPGTFWFYNNWDFNVLSTIFQQASKKDFFQQFFQRIAQPLEMEQFRLADTEYHFETEHSSHPAYLFRMSALDLGRFGLLYLRKGNWRGQQILSHDWIQRSIQNYSVLNPKHPERGYGYLWWLDQGMYYAAGTGGQRLFIVPELGVVIVHRVDTDSKVRVKNKSIWTLFEKVLEARQKQ